MGLQAVFLGAYHQSNKGTPGVPPPAWHQDLWALRDTEETEDRLEGGLGERPLPSAHLAHCSKVLAAAALTYS